MRPARRVAFAAVMILVPLGLLEVLVRVLDRRDPVVEAADGGLEFRFLPRAVLPGRDGVALNDRGFWDVDRPVERPAGVTRLVMLGDSFTFGYTAHADTIPGVIERELQARRPDRVEVHNLGVLAYGTDQEVVLLEREALPRRPDVVLIGFYVGNDVRDNARTSERTVLRGGKKVPARKATLLARVLRLSALFRFFDDGAYRRSAPEGALQKELRLRARLRREQVEQLFARQAEVDATTFRDVAADLAREWAIDRELLDGVPEARWLPREREAVAAAEKAAREAPTTEALRAALDDLERRAARERDYLDYGDIGVEVHERFVPVYRPDGKTDEETEKGWAETEVLLARARDLCKAAGAELRVIVLPSEVQVSARARAELLALIAKDGLTEKDLDLEAPQRRLAAILARLGVPGLDVLPALREADLRERTFWQRNTHMNETGNRVVGRLAAEWLAPALPPPR